MCQMGDGGLYQNVVDVWGPPEAIGKTTCTWVGSCPPYYSDLKKLIKDVDMVKSVTATNIRAT